MNEANVRTGVAIIVVVGVALAFASAVAPFYGTSYVLLATVLFAGLAPYAVYAVVAWLLPRPWVVGLGVALLIVHAALVIVERALDQGDYSDGAIYWVPLVLAVLMSPLLVPAFRSPWAKRAHADEAPQAGPGKDA